MEDITEFTEFEFTEPENRYCPICDKRVKKGSPYHKCSKRKLNELDKHYAEIDNLKEEERTFDDKLKEFDEYSNENYYDLEEKEEE